MPIIVSEGFETGASAELELLDAGKKDIDRKSDWYKTFLEELKNTAVEGEFAWRWALIECRHEIGVMIVTAAKDQGVSIRSLLKAVVLDAKLSWRTLYYCVKFATKFPDLDDVPFPKSISFREIIDKHLTTHGDKPAEEEAKSKTRRERLVEELKDIEDAVSAQKEYVQMHGCVICGAESEGHHWPKTRGAGAKEWEMVPLCRTHHIAYQDLPDALFLNNPELVMDYFYTTQIILWKSYLEAVKALGEKK